MRFIRHSELSESGINRQLVGFPCAVGAEEAQKGSVVLARRSWNLSSVAVPREAQSLMRRQATISETQRFARAAAGAD